MSRDLAPADLRELDPEPRIRDLDLAAALGFELDYDIRKLIRRNAAELAAHGVIFATVAKITPDLDANPKGAGRPGQEFWLNEPQALLICMFARTARAAEVRRQVIEVYLAWRRGRAVAPQVVPPAGDRVAAARFAPLEEAARRLEPAEEQALALALAPVWANGQRPKFWSDFDVRVLMVRTHRQMRIEEARGLCAERYGPARTPSRSALCRLWLALDRVRAVPGPLPAPLARSA